MYVESKEWIEENIKKYSLSIKDTNRVLEETDYKYEEDRITLFNTIYAIDGSKYYRYNSKGEVLEICYFVTEFSTVNNHFEEKYELNMQLVGIKYEVNTESFETFLKHYYYSYELEESEKRFHVFNSSTIFESEYDPYYSWRSDFL